MCAFQKPSTVTIQPGFIGYKGTIPDPPLNYIDNQFPNCLDKTNGDTISGTVTFSNNVTFSTGSNIIMDSGTDIGFESGALLTALAGSIFSINGSVTIGTAGNLSVNGSFDIGSDSIQFTDVGNPITIFQDSASITAGQPMNIEAQSTFSSATAGGTLVLKGGNATSSGSYGGSVQISGGSGNVADGAVNINSGANNMLSIGISGIGLGKSTVPIVSGTNILSASQFIFPWIQLSAVGGLSGNALIQFPSGLGPAVWVVNTKDVVFNGFNISFECGATPAFNGPVDNTSNKKFFFVAESDDSNSLIGI